MNTDSYKDWTIVVQGPVSDPEWLYRRITKLRKCAPGVQIHLSTWRGTVVDESVFDLIIYADDPGGSPLDKAQIGPFCLKASTARRPVITNNLQRLIVSSVTGLRTVRTPFALKCRTDFLPANTRIMDAYPEAAKSRPLEAPAEYLVFKQPVITLEWFSRDPMLIPYLHHPGDIIVAGYTEDVTAFFDAPLPAKIRHCNEQYLWINCIGRKRPLKFPHGCCFSPATAIESDKYMLLNFRFFPMGDESDFFTNKSLARHNKKPTCYQSIEQARRIHALNTASYHVKFYFWSLFHYLGFTARGLLGCVKRTLLNSPTKAANYP